MTTAEDGMSNVVRARELLELAEQKRAEAMELLEDANVMSLQARKLMYREPQVRRARAATVHITDEMREEIERLKKDRRLTQADIARKVGLRNGGRVSEVMHGKR